MIPEPVWWSLIGPLPLPSPTGVITAGHDRTRILAGPVVVGPLRLRPGDRRLTEYLRPEPLSLDGFEIIDSWPVIVEGFIALNDEPSELNRSQKEDPSSNAFRSSTADLHRLCGLISLAWDEPSQLRTAPTGSRRLQARVPDSWLPPLSHWSLDPDPIDPVPHELPNWVAPAWKILAADSRCVSALTFWHQGLLLTPMFPSFALTAFAGSIEASAGTERLRSSLGPPADRCSTCGNVPGATARFWSAVSLVTSEEDVRHLKKDWNVYGLRSRTAHGGTTHGIEEIFGLPFLLDYQPGPPATVDIDHDDPAQVFMLRTLPALRVVAANLLRAILTSPYPTPIT